MEKIVIHLVLVLSSSIIFSASIIAKEISPFIDDPKMTRIYVVYMILSAVVGFWNLFMVYIKTSESKNKLAKKVSYDDTLQGESMDRKNTSL